MTPFELLTVLRRPPPAWRHHGLGLLQTEIDESQRVHVWHPSLRTIPNDDFRAVHDHRFDLESRVLVGAIVDSRYLVKLKSGAAFADTSIWEIKHAKIQDGADARWVGHVNVTPEKTQAFSAGETYRVPRRVFHTTAVEAIAITLVKRTNFDSQPARILGAEGKSGILKFADEDPVREAHDKLVEQVLCEARAKGAWTCE